LPRPPFESALRLGPKWLTSSKPCWPMADANLPWQHRDRLTISLTEP
jgi:hypothetical protein